jgi:acyl carrier protein
VKIRGFRVEPQEAEAAVAALEPITAAAVVAQETGGERRLAAFYVSEVEVRSTAMRRSLAAQLPLYLVPATFTRLDALPLTANGKIDRAALASRVSRVRPSIDTVFRAPGVPLEAWLVACWQEVMDIDQVGVDDDFFELGGNSLLATRITGEIAAEYDVLVTARVFYENSTVAELAAAVAALHPDGDTETGRR